MEDPRPVKLFDRDNRQVGELHLPPRAKTEAPRKIVWQGRTFIEGDGRGFYAEGEFAEVIDP